MAGINQFVGAINSALLFGGQNLIYKWIYLLFMSTSRILCCPLVAGNIRAKPLNETRTFCWHYEDHHDYQYTWSDCEIANWSEPPRPTAINHQRKVEGADQPWWEALWGMCVAFKSRLFEIMAVTYVWIVYLAEGTVKGWGGGVLCFPFVWMHRNRMATPSSHRQQRTKLLLGHHRAAWRLWPAVAVKCLRSVSCSELSLQSAEPI